ncbi:MAG: hypothetical protein MRY83_13350 [Flavobacteriales bacterium]|nr:hypothetical protein [Flavobacteriales bacterium]
MNKTIIAICSICLFSCSQGSGPCEYDIATSVAEVQGIQEYEKSGKKLYRVRLSFDKSALAGEQQYLNDLIEHEIDTLFLAKNRIWIGNKYATTVSKKTDNGNCQDLIVSFDHKWK